MQRFLASYTLAFGAFLFAVLCERGIIYLMGSGEHLCFPHSLLSYVRRWLNKYREEIKMNTDVKSNDLIHLIIEDEEEKALESEEVIHLLLDRKLSENTSANDKNAMSTGAKMADGIAKFVGSWSFIIIFTGSMAFWVILNAAILSNAVDPYPFILLNLILSCIAAIQAPVIMMSQNRQEEKDRLRSLNDYKTNLKAEIIIEDLHQKIDTLIANQEVIIKKLGLSDKGVVPQGSDESKNIEL
jgi:uncharacterized membrane protein